MRIPQSYVQKCKIVAHIFQILFIFISGCITLSVMTRDGPTGGGTKYFFALSFLSIPALVYLVMVPMWSRCRRFANAYAFLSVDALYTILWFAAFISIAMWNAAGIKEGAKDKKVKDGEGNCTTFKYGSEQKCNLSRATVGLGAVVFIFFLITTGISSYYLVKFRKDGILPYESHQTNPHHASGESQKDNAWSTEIEQQDSDDEDRHTERGGRQEEDEYALLNSTETDDGRHPGRPLSWGEDRFRDTSYAPYDNNPNALSPGGYEEYRGAAQMPEATSYGGAGSSYGGGGLSEPTSYVGGKGYSFDRV